MKSTAKLFLIVALCFLTHARAEASEPKAYIVLSWADIYKPLMKDIESKGEARYFGKIEGIDYEIDFAGAMAIAKYDREYLENFLNQKAAEGYDFVAVLGAEMNTRYVFRKKEK